MRMLRFLTLLIVFLFPFQIADISAEDDGLVKLVYIIPVEREVERGLEAFLKTNDNRSN